MLARVLLLVLLVASAAAAAQPAQRPPRDSSARATVAGTATIRGRVVAGDTGKPLRRARITASAPELAGQPRNTSTDADGRYELTDLPAGRYTVRVSRGGYLPLVFGQRRPREQGKPVQVGDREVLDHVDFSLPRMSAIGGRVLDETGDPIGGVTVFAVRAMFRDGHRQLVPSGGFSDPTDEIGEYRLRGLAPGTYYVMGFTRETWTVARDGVKQVMGYSPTYFPGTTHVTEARRVTVRVGEQVSNADFALVPGRAARISGTALDSRGRPFRQVSVEEEIRGDNFASFGTVASAAVSPDGTFLIQNVPPGEYMMEASTGRDTPEPQVALQPITVDAADIDNVALTGSVGAIVSGRVLTDEGSIPSIPRLYLSIRERATGQPSPAFLSLGSGETLVGEDGTFTVKGVVGRSWIRVQLPDAWAVKAVLYEGRDIADSPIELKSGDTMDVQVIVTNKVSTLSGQLSDDKGAPVTDGTVVAFATDAEKWTQSSRFVRAARPDQQGRWQIKGLPAGEFVAVAVDYVEEGQWNDPEFLESVRQYGRKLTLFDAASEVVPLKLVSTERQ